MLQCNLIPVGRIFLNRVFFRSSTVRALGANVGERDPQCGIKPPMEDALRGHRSGYDDLQALFLMRLVRIMKLREELRPGLPERDVRCRLIDAAFRSTLGDCKALGIEAEAHALLEAD